MKGGTIAVRMHGNESFFERLAGKIPAMIAVYNIHTGTYLYVNKGITTLLGYQPEDFINGGIPFVFSLVHPDDVEGITAQNQDALTRANRGENVNAEFEYRMRRKDDTWCWLHTDGSVFSRLPDGKVESVLNVSIDITERKRMEEALRIRIEQEPSRLEAIVESSDDAIVSKTLDGIIRSWNHGAEVIFGYTPEEAIGKHISLIIPKERLDEETLILSRLKKGERIDHFDTKRVDKFGVLKDISLTISPIKDSTGKIVGASKIARDVTIRKRHEEELRKEQQRKDEFLAVLAHELRNPLSPISSATQILQLTDSSSAEGKWAVEVIHRQLHHMTRLIDDLLDISRITSNKLKLRKDNVSVQEFVQAAIETSQPLIQAGNHQLFTEYSPVPSYVYGDSVRLAQIVANLLTNAAKYTPPGGTIWLQVGGNESEVTISVRDTGIGISAEMQPRIFEMFVQGDRSSHSARGLGIGLTLVQRLLEMHGGRVKVFSEGPDKGSTFTIHLPKSTQASQSDQLSGGKSTPSPLRILVVDDNKDAVAALEVALRLQGNKTEIAYDGLEAVKAAQTFNPDVVLLDIGMPNMNGYEAAKLIRSQKWEHPVKLVAITGWGQYSDKLKAKEAGFDYHLTKPVDSATLTNLLSTFRTTI